MKTELKKIIVDAGGVIPFEQFMAHALYHPQLGYYTAVKDRLGPNGDFVTAPELTSLFGELLALQFIEVWQYMGSPERFQLVEMGPGSGCLAKDILRTAKRFPVFYKAVDYCLVEISPDFQAMQKASLAASGFADKANWFADLHSAAGDEGIVGAIFGNEFLDALPVYWLEETASGLQEVGVRMSQSGEPGDFTATVMPLSNQIAADYFVRRDIKLAEGTRTEIGLQAQQWTSKAGALLQRGMLLLLDYGHPQKEYYAPLRLSGTLAGHFKHVRVDNPLDHPGEMDLTAHVDFSAIRDAGINAGLELLGYTSQGWFLMGLGILERLEMLLNADSENIGNLKEAVMRLILPEGMGETFKVIAMGRDIENLKPSGFRLQDQSMRL